MNKITAICFIAVISFTGKIFNSCLNSPTTRQIQAIHVLYNLPLSNWDGASADVVTSYDVFYTGDIIMYKFFYNFDSTTNGKLSFSEKRNDFFIFHKDSLFGYVYNPYSSHSLPEGKLPVDSVLKKNSLESARFDTLLNFKPDTSYFDSDGNLLNIYNPPMRKGDYTNYTLHFYYTKKLKTVKETLSRKLDTIKNMKLFRIRILPNKAFREGFPQREILYEMKEIPVENREELLYYFNRYKKEQLKS